MTALRDLFSNKWFKFAVVTLVYALWVIWARNYWLLFGIAIIFDIYITKKVKWAFWKKQYKKGEKRNALLDWLDAIIFALVAATLIRNFFVEAYTIPTPSMEKSLLVGDYLFVSKVAYGPKMPNTPISFPLVHNTLPGSSKNSFVDWIQSPYKRIAGLGEVKRNDVVVFNFPHGDTVIAKMPDQDYYYYIRSFGRERIQSSYKLIIRPVDKRDNYIKRCAAIAGDTLRIEHGNVVVNGIPQAAIPKKQANYKVKTNGNQINSLTFDEMDIANVYRNMDPQTLSYFLPLTDENFERIKSFPNVVSVEKEENAIAERSSSLIFPFDERYPWTEDNFGPLWIPKRGVTVELTMDNLPVYNRIISVYEANKLEVKDNAIYINDIASTTYTFKMDYFFMMGDNRHNSLDSRFWGFVPEDHIVGKAWFIWFSSDPEKSFPKNIRWSRIFNIIK